MQPKEPTKIKEYAVDRIVGGVGGDLVEKSARKIARRIGVVTSIVLTLITAILPCYDAYGFFKYNNGRFITDKFYVEAIQ